MLDTIPNKEKITALVGKSLYEVWNELCALIDENYAMDCLWNKGGKAWKYEYKYRRGGKTLCALYARENCIGFMVILGKDERLKFEADRENYTREVQEIYDKAQTYHDGKWMMFEPVDTSLFDDFMKLLRMKRKPNRNQTGSEAAIKPYNALTAQRIRHIISAKHKRSLIEKHRPFPSAGAFLSRICS